MLVSLSLTKELANWGADRSLRILYIRPVAFVWKRLVSWVLFQGWITMENLRSDYSFQDVLSVVLVLSRT